MDELIDGRFRIVGELGEGGMGTVLVAEHVELQRRVALKVLKEDIGDDASMRKRFQREARTLAAMQHPNIVAINDYGIWKGQPYLVMELLEGQTLRELLDTEGALEEARAIAIARQILRALAYAHAQQVIHRDLKPGNVFLQALPDHQDHVKLLDFGFAKYVGASSASIVTGDGILVGTPAYMAPEQATDAAHVDHRADIYAAGVLLFEMLTGKKPLEGTAIEILRARLKEPAPKLADRSDAQFSPELEAVVAEALARDLVERYSSASEFADALAALAGSVEPPPEPSSISITIDSEELRASVPPKASILPWMSIGAGALVASALAALYVPPLLAPAPVRPPAVIVAPAPGPPPPPPPRPEPPPEPRTPSLPPDPWRGDVDPELLELRRELDRTQPAERELRAIGAYARRHPEQALPLVLRGHAAVRAGWLTGAVEDYEQALARDPHVRGDPEMLENLLVLTGSPRHGERATELLVRTYGAEALPAIEGALLDARGDDAATARLSAVRARIEAME